MMSIHRRRPPLPLKITCYGFLPPLLHLEQQLGKNKVNSDLGKWFEGLRTCARLALFTTRDIPTLFGLAWHPTTPKTLDCLRRRKFNRD